MEELPVQNINEIKLNQKDWNYFAILNEKLLKWCKNNFDFTEYTKEKALSFVTLSIKSKFKHCEVGETTYIKEDFTYLYPITYGNQGKIMMAISLREANGYPNLIPSDELNTGVNII